MSLSSSIMSQGCLNLLGYESSQGRLIFMDCGIQTGVRWTDTQHALIFPLLRRSGYQSTMVDCGQSSTLPSDTRLCLKRKWTISKQTAHNDHHEVPSQYFRVQYSRRLLIFSRPLSTKLLIHETCHRMPVPVFNGSVDTLTEVVAPNPAFYFPLEILFFPKVILLMTLRRLFLAIRACFSSLCLFSALIQLDLGLFDSSTSTAMASRTKSASGLGRECRLDATHPLQHPFRPSWSPLPCSPVQFPSLI